MTKRQLKRKLAISEMEKACFNRHYRFYKSLAIRKQNELEKVREENKLLKDANESIKENAAKLMKENKELKFKVGDRVMYTGTRLKGRPVGTIDAVETLVGYDYKVRFDNNSAGVSIWYCDEEDLIFSLDQWVKKKSENEELKAKLLKGFSVCDGEYDCFSCPYFNGKGKADCDKHRLDDAKKLISNGFGGLAKHVVGMEEETNG